MAHRKSVRRVGRLLGLATLIAALFFTLAGPQLALAQKDDDTDIIPIAYGDTVSGTISAAAYEVVYSFDGQAGDVITVSLTAITSGLDTYLVVYDMFPSQNPLTFDDDGGEGLNSLLQDYSLPATGTYYLVATRYGRETGTSEGDFTLTLSSANSSGGGDTVSGGAFGGLPTGGGQQTGGQDLAFSCNGVNVPAATMVTFEDVRPGFTYRVTVLGLDGFDPVIGLEAEDGSSLCNDDEPLAVGSQVAVPGTGLVTADYLTAQIMFTTSGAIGDIMMRIGGFGGQGGRYVAVFEGLAIAPSTEQDAVTLQVSDSIRNETIYVYQVSRTTALDPYMGLAGTNIICDDAGIGDCADTPPFPGGGVSITNGSTYVAGALDAGIGVVPGNETEMTFVFESYAGLSAGDYAMIVIGAAPGAGSGTTNAGGQTTGGSTESNGIPLQFGVPAQGTISNEAYFELYAFTGQAGQTVTIDMTAAAGSSLDTLLGLLDYNDEVLEENDDVASGNYNSSITYTLPYSGNYYIFATRYGIDEGTSTGAYTLVVTAGGTSTGGSTGGNTGGTASGGEVVVTLTWQGTADMDIAVMGPDGEQVSFENPNGSNGVALNPIAGNDYCESVGNPPTEIITIPANIASGDWLVGVQYSLDCGAGATSYTVTVTQNGTVLYTWNDSHSTANSELNVYEMTLGG